jgi:hypothetical protein
MADVTVPASQDAGRPSARHRIVGAVLAAAIVVVLAVVGLAGPGRWWGAAGSPPSLIEGGWMSDDIDSVMISTPTDRTRIFVCEPGTLSMWIGFVVDEGHPTRIDGVQLPWFDDMWTELGWVTRQSIEMMPDLTGRGDLDSMVPFEPVQLESEEDWLRMKVTYDIHECTTMEGITYISGVDVTYTSSGRTHTASVELLEPLRLTTQGLDSLEQQVEVVRSDR